MCKLAEFIDDAIIEKGAYVSTSSVKGYFEEIVIELKKKNFEYPDYDFQIYDTLESSGHKLSPEILSFFFDGMKTRGSDVHKTLKIMGIDNTMELKEHFMFNSISMNEEQRNVLRTHGATNIEMFQTWMEEESYNVSKLSNEELTTLSSILGK